MKRPIGLIAQHLQVRTFNVETALCSKGLRTREVARLSAIVLMALAGCAQPHIYHTQTSEPAPRVGELVLPVAIGIDGPTVRWRCTYAAADTGQELTVEESAAFCDYHRAIP